MDRLIEDKYTIKQEPVCSYFGSLGTSANMAEQLLKDMSQVCKFISSYRAIANDEEVAAAIGRQATMVAKQISVMPGDFPENVAKQVKQHMLEHRWPIASHDMVWSAVQSKLVSSQARPCPTSTKASEVPGCKTQEITNAEMYLTHCLCKKLGGTTPMKIFNYMRSTLRVAASSGPANDLYMSYLPFTASSPA